MKQLGTDKKINSKIVFVPDWITEQVSIFRLYQTQSKQINSIGSQSFSSLWFSEMFKGFVLIFGSTENYTWFIVIFLSKDS